MKPDGVPTPLSELRVVEISDRIAGSYCGKLLIDAGAEVRKVEPPQGDPLRRFTMGGSAVPDGADAPLFSYLNAGKRSISTAVTGERCRAELSAADVIVLTATRSQAADLGINLGQLLNASPRVIVVTISDFGWSGPYAERAASEFTLQAWSGLTGFPWRSCRTADFDRRPPRGVHGRRVRRVRDLGAVSPGSARWIRRTPRHVHAGSHHLDAER